MKKKLILFTLSMTIFQASHAGLRPSSPYTNVLSCHVGQQYFQSSSGYQIDLNKDSLSNIKFKGTSDIVTGKEQKIVKVEENSLIKIKTLDDKIKILIDLSFHESQIGQEFSDVAGQILGGSDGRHIDVYKGRVQTEKTILGISLGTTESDIVCSYE